MRVLYGRYISSVAYSYRKQINAKVLFLQKFIPQKVPPVQYVSSLATR